VAGLFAIAKQIFFFTIMRKVSYIIFVVLVVSITAEIILRLLGYQPGVFRKIDGFEKVDSLVLYKNFETDEDGIYKFSKWVSDSLVKYYDPKWGRITNSEVEAALYPVDNLDDIVKCYKYITNPELSNQFKLFFYKNDWNSPSLQKYREALNTPIDSTDEWGEALKHFLSHPFNAEGFRSIEFKKHKTKRKRIFIIGDSFVYGMSANPFYNSFYDVLLSQGYMVYAAGIPGTDPAQYAAIAQKYVPLLEPDQVIVCFFPGNDLMPFKREPEQDEPHEYITNAGFYQSNINGRHFNARDAYGHYLASISIPTSKNWVNNIMSQTAIGSILWGFLFSKNIPITEAYSPMVEQIANTKIYTDKISEVCTTEIVPLAIVALPNTTAENANHQKFLMQDTTTLHSLFGNNFYYPFFFELSEHFPKNDYHFNNAGHQLFAEYLKGIIDTLK
jgi:lysophospholipase L1-like esterase